MSQVLGLGMYKGCSMDEKKTRLVGASLFMAPLLSIPVKQRRGRNYGKQEEWRFGG